VALKNGRFVFKKESAMQFTVEIEIVATGSNKDEVIKDLKKKLRIESQLGYSINNTSFKDQKLKSVKFPNGEMRFMGKE
jgi:hypothetical protein